MEGVDSPWIDWLNCTGMYSVRNVIDAAGTVDYGSLKIID